MSQIRVGDRVAPILNMHLTGEVVLIKSKPHATMMTEGPLTYAQYATVKHDKGGNTLEYRVRDLVRLDR